MKKIWVIFLCVTQCYADPVILGGSYSSVPLVDSFSTPGLAASSVAIPVGNTGSIYSVAMGVDGTSVLAGRTSAPNPLAYKVFAGGSVAIPITGMATGDLAEINGVAIGPDGTAIIVGANYTSHTALIYKVNPGSTEAISITPPTGADGQKILEAVAIGSDGTAIMGGWYSSSGSSPVVHPAIYRLAPGATSVTTVGVPSGSDGKTIWSVAIAPGGTAILGGGSFSADGAALLCQLAPGAPDATSMIFSDNEANFIASVAIGLDGTAVVGGQSKGTYHPLIYRIPTGSSVASRINGTSSLIGWISGVAIGPDGAAIAVGEIQGGSSNIPLVYRLNSEATSVTTINIFPEVGQGSLNSVAIGSDGIAIMGGSDLSSGMPLIYTVGSHDSVTTWIANPNTNPGRIWGVAVPPIHSDHLPEGLYNIDRIRPIYEAELYETKNKLHQAGL